ncbi:MAG: GNAT family N-acetyltransferase, partial [Bacteroides sp.]|nr:GNAT family N-acetyltransferase [Bacteroides sp.]
GLVFRNTLPVGAGIILRSGQNISIPWASTLKEYNRLNPNMLLYWNFLQFAADSGNTRFDFGRSTPDEGTYRFKAQWGALPQQLIWHNILLKKQRPPQNHSEKSYRKSVEQIWKRIPLSLANFVGPIVRRYITL